MATRRLSRRLRNRVRIDQKTQFMQLKPLQTKGKVVRSILHLEMSVHRKPRDVSERKEIEKLQNSSVTARYQKEGEAGWLLYLGRRPVLCPDCRSLQMRSCNTTYACRCLKSWCNLSVLVLELYFSNSGKCVLGTFNLSPSLCPSLPQSLRPFLPPLFILFLFSVLLQALYLFHNDLKANEFLHFEAQQGNRLPPVLGSAFRSSHKCILLSR